jgi:hypothetical protein
MEKGYDAFLHLYLFYIIEKNEQLDKIVINFKEKGEMQCLMNFL